MGGERRDADFLDQLFELNRNRYSPSFHRLGLEEHAPNLGLRLVGRVFEECRHLNWSDLVEMFAVIPNTTEG